MRVWVYVEGPSDKQGLEALWRPWQQALAARRIGLTIGHLDNKGNFLRVFGQRAARSLAASNEDIVVGLPDLYPNRAFAGTDRAHADAHELGQVLTRSVRDSLIGAQGIPEREVEGFLQRLHSSAMKHDFEMLLLAAVDELRTFLHTGDELGKWRHPVEDQDQEHPPKYLVGELFAKYRKRSYKDTVDAPAVLRQVKDVGDILRSKHVKSECPVFKEALDWLGEKTRVPLYSFQSGEA